MYFNQQQIDRVNSIKHLYLDGDAYDFFVEGKTENGELIRLYLKFANNLVVDAKCNTIGGVEWIIACDEFCQYFIGKSIEELGSLLTIPELCKAFSLKSPYRNIIYTSFIKMFYDICSEYKAIKRG